MKKVLIAFIFLIFSIKTVYAHNPLSAMYYLEVNNELGILSVSVSQTGLHEALLKSYSKIDFEQLPEDEYKKLAVKYLKNNFSLSANGELVKLLNGGLKLGDHQTDFKFITSSLPKKINSLDVTVHAFQENENHQTIFSVAINDVMGKVILGSKNDYSSNLIFKDNKLITKSKTSLNPNYIWFIAFIPFVLVVKRIIPIINKV